MWQKMCLVCVRCKCSAFSLKAALVWNIRVICDFLVAILLPQEELKIWTTAIENATEYETEEPVAGPSEPRAQSLPLPSSSTSSEVPSAKKEKEKRFTLFTKKKWEGPLNVRTSKRASKEDTVGWWRNGLIYINMLHAFFSSFLFFFFFYIMLIFSIKNYTRACMYASEMLLWSTCLLCCFTFPP